MYVRRRAKKYECLIRYKGARFQKSFERKGNAVRWGHKSIAELEAGTYVDRDKLFSMQLKDLLQLYFDHVKAQTKRPHLLKYTIDMLCKTKIGKSYLPQIDGVKLSKFKNEMLETRSTTTVRKYLLLISRAITVGQKELGVPIFNNPVKQVTLPKEPAHRDRVLTEAERLGLYKACENNPIYFMHSFVELLFETLCRRGELMALRFEDINFLDKTALIRITKNGKPRKIGLSVRAIEIIKSIPRNVSGELFITNGTNWFEKCFKRAVAKAEISNFKMHDLRHCGATYLAEQGWSTQELMAQGGWSSAEMVKKYSNISSKHLAKRLRIIRS
jgi:integrase